MTETGTPNQSGRRTLYLLFGIAVVPMLAAYTMFFTGWGVPTVTKNNGVLLSQPLSLQTLISEQRWQTIAVDKKWRLLLPVPDKCAQACQQNFYTTRQVHIRLSEKSDRLQRLALNVGADSGQAYLDSIALSHPKLTTDMADSPLWREWVSPVESDLASLGDHYYFLVDQEGYAIMAYGTEHDGNALLSDIKHALKFSIDYN